MLEVRDWENLNIKQDPKNILINAEAFDITVGIQFNNPEGILNFENVRVFDEKVQTFSIKNNGIYEVQYKFEMGKK